MNYNLYKGTKLIEHWTNQIVSQIKSVDGYNNDMEVAMLGNLDDLKYEKSVYVDHNFDTNVNHWFIHDIFCEGYYKRQDFFRDFANYNFELPNYTNYNDISDIDNTKVHYYMVTNENRATLHSNDPRIKAMPSCPQKGYIKVIDDVIVVKFSD